LKKPYVAVAAIITAVLLTAVFLSGCQSSGARLSAAGKKHDKLKVVTTFAPLYSLALNVAGDAAEVENLVPIGASIHTFQARPSDIRKISQADVLIKNGVGLETFLNGITDAAANPHLMVVDTSRSIKILDGDADEKASGDPHIWLSPKNAVKQVVTIRDALAKADPDNAGTYQRNTAFYIKKLERLDADITRSLAATKKKKYIVFHNAYRYFEREYDLRSAAAIEEFPGREPGPRYLKGVMDMIKNQGVGIVFIEPQFSPKIVDTLKQDFTIYVGVLDPTGNKLSKDGYEENLRRNLKSLEEAFSKGGGK
jgi:zinc/manganese transport system substrate-binding protein